MVRRSGLVRLSWAARLTVAERLAHLAGEPSAVNALGAWEWTELQKAHLRRHGLSEVPAVWTPV